MMRNRRQRAIEADEFPFETLSEIAELESWRKEINRPLTHIHKWWAQRLGSVFRATVLGSFLPDETDPLTAFYQPARISGVVFDPFMGSGTTISEVLKLGGRAIGRDINSVAYHLVRTAMGRHERAAVLNEFERIERDVAPKIQRHYTAVLTDGTTATILYSFWVMTAACPSCAREVDLFSSYVFARHAYPSKNPEASVLCPRCGGVHRARFDAETLRCPSCSDAFNPQQGPASGRSATCHWCSTKFSIAEEVRRAGGPPSYRLYAKLVLMPDGKKVYLPTTDDDRARFAEAENLLKRQRRAYPLVAIPPGYNTDQARSYGFRRWHELFNSRQLLCIGLLAERVRAIERDDLRDLFTCLLSGTLEFNSMFASFKGEGTGAVRHMFSHHILKPERTPLEANLWGTPRSSGSFSTLFESRILRALDYAERPFEIRPTRRGGQLFSEKVFGLSDPLGAEVAASFDAFRNGGDLYLSCGDSATTDIETGSVDAVITDPPFFDNVNYSELADFFHAWQEFIRGGNGTTTRCAAEVQTAVEADFSARLQKVFEECHRVLKRTALMVFSYHHSRQEGWSSLVRAIMGAGFVVTASQPVKAEMSVAAPKQHAKEPIDVDILIVCRKRTASGGEQTDLTRAIERARCQVARFGASNRRLSRNDVRVILMGQVLRELTAGPSVEAASAWLAARGSDIEAAISQASAAQILTKAPAMAWDPQIPLLEV
jgi:putative DNA methylase